MEKQIRKVLVVGAKGFIGTNLVKALRLKNNVVLEYDKDDSEETLYNYIKEADFIYHFAAVQRPLNQDYTSNLLISNKIIDCLVRENLKTPVFFSSSIQAELDNPYGICKREEERLFLDYANKYNSKLYICRFSNIFGPGSRPNYTSVVSTFIYNCIKNLQITINNVDTTLNLIYIDDIINYLMGLLSLPTNCNSIQYLSCFYTIDLVDLICIINSIKQKKKKLLRCFDKKLVKDLETTYSYFENKIEREGEII